VVVIIGGMSENDMHEIRLRRDGSVSLRLASRRSSVGLMEGFSWSPGSSRPAGFVTMALVDMAESMDTVILIRSVQPGPSKVGRDSA